MAEERKIGQPGSLNRRELVDQGVWVGEKCGLELIRQ